MIGTYRSVFHSALVKMGEVHLAIKSDVMKSKKEGKPDYVIISYDGGQDQFLSMENDRCKAAMQGLKGKSITIRATGSRGDANIEVLNSDGTVRAPEAPQRSFSGAAGSGQPSPEKVTSQWYQAAMLALETVHALKLKHDAEFPEMHMKPEQFQVLVSGLLIYMDRKGAIDSFPVSEKLEEKKEPEKDNNDEGGW